MVTLEEAEIGKTIAWLWSTHGERAEGAGACGAGAVLLQKLQTIKTPAAIVVSGGNIDDARLESARAGRAA